MPEFSTHTLRHLRLTHLARSGWRLHEIASYAGHRNVQTTMQYIHLSGNDLLAKMARSVEHGDAKLGRPSASDAINPALQFSDAVLYTSKSISLAMTERPN